jgi:DNA-binding CsgD family transcriptional regulator
MVLTSKQREKLVLELYSQGKTIKEIAKEAKMSFRDIGVILKETGKQEEQAQRQSIISSQAYKLFSEGKTAMQVAIDLSLRQNEVTILCREYWNLAQLDNLNAVYEETKGDIWPLVNLHVSIKAAGMNNQHIIRLLEIANNGLPAG